MRSRRLMVHRIAACLALFPFGLPAQNVQIWTSGGWTVYGPRAGQCGTLPLLEAKGSGSIFDSRNASILSGFEKALPASLAPSCPGVREVVLVSGRERRLIRVAVRSQSAPAAPATLAETPAQASAAPPVRASQPESPGASAPGRAAPPQSPLPAPIPEPAGVSIAGTWVGVYQIYPSYVQMTLTIPREPDASGQTSAEIRLEGLNGKNAPQMGVTPAVVRYNGAARSLDIMGMADGSRSISISGVSFHFVYDSERQVFAGYRGNAAPDASPYLLLVRKGQEGRYFKRLEEMPDVAKPNRPGVGTSLAGRFGVHGVTVGGHSPSADELRRWASQIYTEYPDLQPYRTEMGTLFSAARNLFRDEYFASFFGKPYDQLGSLDLTKTSEHLQSLPAPRANFPEERGNGAAMPLASAFRFSVGTYTAADIMLSVLALRSISAWMNETLRRLPSMRASSGIFAALSDIEAEEQQSLASLWPSERLSFLKAIAAQRSRLADPVLTVNVNQLVSSAARFDQAPSLQQAISALLAQRSAPVAPSSVAALRRGAPAVPVRRSPSNGDDLNSLASMASEPVRQQLRAALEKKITELVEAEASNDASSITKFPVDAAGLENGIQWYRSMDRKYAGFRSNPAVTAMFSTFTQSRTRIFAQAAPALRAQIAALPSADQIDGLLSRYASGPGDNSMAEARTIFGAAQERKAELDRQAAERARIAAAEAARKEQEARDAAERAWRRRMPPPTETVRLGLADMNPKPGAKPLEQALASVFTILTSENTMGSAFLISKDGLAITNHHVVRNDRKIVARFPNGELFTARVWRTNPENDFALIQIDCPKDCYTSYFTMDPLPPAGTDIYVIGTPESLDYTNSVSKGIVSGLRRNGGKIDIQSDAAMNHGNSGGPMVEAATGRVIGVVTWGEQVTNGIQGIGFAGSILDAFRCLGITLE